MKSIRMLMALAAPALLLACQRDNQPEPRLTPARGAMPESPSRSTDQMGTSHDRAVRAVSEYLCDREIRCGRLEADVEARDSCIQNRVSGGFESLQPNVCGQIENQAMSLCLNSIRTSTDCSADADFQSIPDCNSDRLCGRGGESSPAPSETMPSETDQPGGETTTDQPDESPSQSP